MEDQVCNHDTFGYWKFKKHCKKDHYSQICPNLGACYQIKVCKKKDTHQIVESSNLTNIAGSESAAPICTITPRAVEQEG